MASPNPDGPTFPASVGSVAIKLGSRKATKVSLPDRSAKPLDILFQCLDEQKRTTFTNKTLIQSSLGLSDEEHRLLIPSRSGFLSTVMRAYNEHHNLVIRPDDVWLTILQRFNTYVNQNVEGLRTKFVAHEGQKVVKIKVKGNRFSHDWGRLSQNLTQKMDEFLVDVSLKQWILPNFTTTTETDVAVASAVMLSTFKGYFRYRVIFSCGIPSVTLMGTREDWESVLQRVQQLHRFGVDTMTLCEQDSKHYKGGCPKVRNGMTGMMENRQRPPPREGGFEDGPGLMENWQRRLEAVLKRLIAAFDGEEDEEFWSHVFTEKRYGSGDQRFLTGWITAFATFEPDFGMVSSYELDGIQFGSIECGDFPVDLAEVPIEIDDNGYKVMGLLTAGVLGAKKLNVDTIGLERAWWMFENKNSGWSQ